MCNLTVAQNVSIGKLKFIGDYEVPHNFLFKGTTVGGLSGIDYDKEKKLYYMISDDRSAINPARYYTAKIIFNEKKIDTVVFVDITTFLNADGKPYPNSKQDAAHTPDPEALRYNPVTKQMFWTSEGERIVKAKDTVLENPAITIIYPDGKYIDTFPLPENLLMHATEKGPRQNGTLEGLTFADDFKTMFVNLEEPLYEDGPRADIKKNNAWIRLFKYDMATKKNIAQYAYELDAVAYPAVPENAFKINGIPDILSVGENKLLVIERSFSTGRLPCTIKIFLADLHDATNIINTKSLKENPAMHPVAKKLLLNMDDLKIYTDNIEGVTFGPDLPNGHKTLIFIADNNFMLFEKTQVMLFEVIP
ncbi:MAG TPA: esterase-like activity of phytase family protein [Chitinophagaceae bacterium]|nr:esterase-like activity of phytase family protein [Chitinophagaceae bacterium]